MQQLSFCHFPFLLRNEEVTGTPAEGWRWSHQDWVCFIYLWFCLYKRMYSHPSGKARAYSPYGHGFNPQRDHFSLFHIFDFFLIFVCMRWALWAWHSFLFLLAYTLFTCDTTLAHFIFIYLFIYFSFKYIF